MKEMTDNLCVGRPIGWRGGQVAFCNGPIEVGTRFCYRCHLVAIKHALERVQTLEAQLRRAKSDLELLVQESNTAEE